MKSLDRFTVAEAAKKAMVSIETVGGWVKKGQLKAIRYAGRIWISGKSIDEVMAPLLEEDK